MITDKLPKTLIGLTEVKAEEAVRAEDGTLQITSKDGEDFMTDMMVDTNRVKVEIKDGLIVKAVIG